MKINKATPDKHNYLRVLTHIPTPPDNIFFKGTLPKEAQPTVAIVGTRKPTPYGKEVTRRLASELAQRGIIVISGLALGTDAIAHQAALDAGGITIAILANSVDTIYPRTNEHLGQEIIARGGAIMSEYEPPRSARGYQFLARNRIISGLSNAVVIVEAATRSGTLATATHALEQGKEVFAVPGNITSPLSAGCNALIKQGARPYTKVEDVLEVVTPHLLEPQMSLPIGRTAHESKILELIHQGTRDGDQLQQHSGLGVSEFSQTLTLMEIGGLIRSLGANQWGWGKTY